MGKILFKVIFIHLKEAFSSRRPKIYAGKPPDKVTFVCAPDLSVITFCLTQ